MVITFTKLILINSKLTVGNCLVTPVKFILIEHNHLRNSAIPGQVLFGYYQQPCIWQVVGDGRWWMSLSDFKNILDV